MPGSFEPRRAILAALSRVTKDPLPFVELLASCPDEATARGRLRAAYGVDEQVAEALLDMSARRLVASNRRRIDDELASLGGQDR